MTVLVAVGVVVALAAAARSTWSPCGLSMLSTITPFGERGRRHRYAATAAWFLAGALAGGATLGAGAAALAAVVGRAGVPQRGVWLAAGAVSAGGALLDAGAFGPVLPLVRRQVDDRWLARYRPWVYGAGFGWQIGVGFATYLMTAGVAVVAALAVLTGSPLQAFALGTAFGVARGCTVFLTAGAATPADLRALHGRLSAAGPSVRRAAAGVQAGAALGLVVAASGVAGLSAVTVSAVAAGAAVAGAAVAVVAGRVTDAGGRSTPAAAGALRTDPRGPSPIIPP